MTDSEKAAVEIISLLAGDDLDGYIDDIPLHLESDGGEWEGKNPAAIERIRQIIDKHMC